MCIHIHILRFWINTCMCLGLISFEVLKPVKTCVVKFLDNGQNPYSHMRFLIENYTKTVKIIWTFQTKNQSKEFNINKHMSLLILIFLIITKSPWCKLKKICFGKMCKLIKKKEKKGIISMCKHKIISFGVWLYCLAKVVWKIIHFRVFFFKDVFFVYI